MLALTRSLEVAQLAVKNGANERANAVERLAEEHGRAMAAAGRAAEEKEVAAVRSMEEEQLSSRRLVEDRVVDLESQLERERARCATHAANLAAAEERGVSPCRTLRPALAPRRTHRAAPHAHAHALRRTREPP